MAVLKPGLAERQIPVVPAVERRSGDTKLFQSPFDRQVRSVNQPDDLKLLEGCPLIAASRDCQATGISLVVSPSSNMLF